MDKDKLKDTVLKTLAVIGVIALLSVGGLVTAISLRNLPKIATNLKAQVINISQRFIPKGSDQVNEEMEDEEVEVQDGGTILVRDNSEDLQSIDNVVPEREAGEKIEELTLFNETGGPVGTKITADPTGRVDLRAKILEVGYIDRITNIFTATSTISTSQRGAVRFVVENIGTRSSNAWTFNVVLPTFPSYIYHSKLQDRLLPGDRIEYTIGFDSIKNDDSPNTITVNVDPTGSISESDETNNIVKSELKTFSN